MNILKNLLDRLMKTIDENELTTSNYLEEVEYKLNNDKEYNLEACKTLLNMNTMFGG